MKDLEIKSLAKEYHLGHLNILDIKKFIKTPSEETGSYETTRGAFIFPIDGRASVYFDEEKFAAQRGIMIHGCPGKKISFDILGSGPFTYINIYYNCVNEQKLFSTEVDINRIIEPLEQLLILEENHSTQAKRKVLLSKVLHELFIDYAVDERMDKRRSVEQAIEYMKKNYQNIITLQDLSSHVHMTSSQFSYLFFKYMGIRPIDYLIDYRIELAIDLLEKDGKNIREAAEQVGYADPLYFSRIFKKRTGYSPSTLK
jgi:AraC-like DNA-binding protein